MQSSTQSPAHSGPSNAADAVVCHIDHRPGAASPYGTAPALVADEADAVGNHPTALRRQLDRYLDAVRRELSIRGVLTGSPQRTELEQRLGGTIVLDCTAVRVAAWTPRGDRPAHQQSLGAALDPDRPAPVILTWDEVSGWCVGLDTQPAASGRRYLHSELLPTPSIVADFVVGLALGRPLGSIDPVTAVAVGVPRLHVVR